MGPWPEHETRLPVSKQGYDSENTKLGQNITCFMAINLHAEITW